jgi:hypothetical protein
MMKLFYEWNKKAKEENVLGKVSSLDISFNQLGNQGIVKILVYYCPIFFVYLLGMESFGFFLEENKSLRKVKIDNNNVTYNGWNAIYNALFVNFTLEKIKWYPFAFSRFCSILLSGRLWI